MLGVSHKKPDCQGNHVKHGKHDEVPVERVGVGGDSNVMVPIGSTQRVLTMFKVCHIVNFVH